MLSQRVRSATDKPDRDGILDPRASESVALPSEIEAFDRWAAEPDNLAAGDVDEALDVARTALLLAPAGPERKRARRELLDLLADRQPLAVSAHFRPAANITDPLPRPILRAAGMSGAVLAEGAVLPVERRGRGRQVHAGHHVGRAHHSAAGAPKKNLYVGQESVVKYLKPSVAAEVGSLQRSMSVSTASATR